jgi:hypothetical protein
MESGLTIERSDENLNTDLATNNLQVSNHTGANGSVITMTLKNNHLIVETEERNVSISSKSVCMWSCPREYNNQLKILILLCKFWCSLESTHL